MGTRADFYVGRGKDAEWLGSIAWDGYPDGIDEYVFMAMNEDSYRSKVQMFLEPRDDATFPHMGWPWPWEDSGTTDYAYAFDGGQVWFSGFGSKWLSAKNGVFEEEETYEDDEGNFDMEAYKLAREDKVEMPNMKAIQNVNYGDRSGVIVVEMQKRT